MFFFKEKKDFINNDDMENCNLLKKDFSGLESEELRNKLNFETQFIRKDKTVFDFSIYVNSSKFNDSPFSYPFKEKMEISKNIFQSFVEGGVKNKNLRLNDKVIFKKYLKFILF